MVEIFDSHAHLNFAAFADDWQQVVASCLDQGVGVINVGAQLASSRQAIEIAKHFPTGVYAAVGLHPVHAPGSDSHSENFVIDAYRELATADDRVVAIGEAGIDFWHDDCNLNSQEAILSRQLQLAKELGLPVILHGRNSKDGSADAYEELLRIVKREGITQGVAHCFGGSPAQAEAFVEQGFFIGITGIVTYAGSTIQEVAKIVPIGRLLVETDSPYLTPEPNRGQKNFPYYVHYVAEKVAELRGVPTEQIIEHTRENTIKLFELPIE